jgi:hypothetical protein
VDTNCPWQGPGAPGWGLRLCGRGDKPPAQQEGWRSLRARVRCGLTPVVGDCAESKSPTASGREYRGDRRAWRTRPARREGRMSRRPVVVHRDRPLPVPPRPLALHLTAPMPEKNQVVIPIAARVFSSFAPLLWYLRSGFRRSGNRTIRTPQARHRTPWRPVNQHWCGVYSALSTLPSRTASRGSA